MAEYLVTEHTYHGAGVVSFIRARSRQPPSKPHGLAEGPQKPDKPVGKTWLAAGSFSDDSLVCPCNPPQLPGPCTVLSSIPYFGHPGSSPTSATSRGTCFRSGLNVEKAQPWKQGLKCSQLPRLRLPTVPWFGVTYISL